MVAHTVLQGGLHRSQGGAHTQKHEALWATTTVFVKHKHQQLQRQLGAVLTSSMQPSTPGKLTQNMA
jgi:hypothetical protein